MGLYENWLEAAEDAFEGGLIRAGRTLCGQPADSEHLWLSVRRKIAESTLKYKAGKRGPIFCYVEIELWDDFGKRKLVKIEV